MNKRDTLLINGFLILVFLMILVSFDPLFAELEKINKDNLRTISGKAGIAFRLDRWRVDDGDLTLTLEGGDAGQMSISNLRIEDPDGAANPFQIANDPGPYGSDAGTRIESGLISDPFEISATNNGNGRLALTYPSNASSFEPADISFRLGFNGTDIGRVTIGNAQWAEGTQFAMGIRPIGGLDIGIELQLDGDAWYTAQTPGSFDNGGIHLEGVFGANNYSCSPPTVNESCFSGNLEWANLDAGRPMQVDIRAPCCGPREIVIERVRVGFGGQGTIGIQNMEFDSTTADGPDDQELGSTVITDLNIRHFKLTAPIP